MKNIIPHSKPTLDVQDRNSIVKVINGQSLAQGKEVSRFEKKLSKYVGVKYGVATNSGSSALHLALLALGVKRQDEVIIPTFVCTALLNAVNYIGAKAQVVDVNYDDFNISVPKVKAAITRKTKAIIVPHMFGLSADIKEISRLKVPLIEDCAHSVGAKMNGEKLGSLGDLGVFSFYATKMLTTGEGGMVVGDRRKYLNNISDRRDYDQKDHNKIRYNYKMTEFQAALGCSQLTKLNNFIRKRKGIAQIYNDLLRRSPCILPSHQKGKDHIYFRYVIKVKKNRNKILNTLKRKGIHAASPVYKPIHQYLGLKGYKVADQLMKESISIPIYPTLRKQQAVYIAELLLKAVS